MKFLKQSVQICKVFAPAIRLYFSSSIILRRHSEHLQLKMNSHKKFPDIYIMSYLNSLDIELKKHLPDNVNFKVVKTDDPKDLPYLLKDAEVLLTDAPPLANLLYDLPNTKWVQNSFAGVEKIMKKLDKSKPLPNFILTRYSDSYFGESMANYVMAQIINIERGFYTYHDKQKISEWDRDDMRSRVLSDLTIGILGAGNLGASVGRYLKRCGSRIIAFVRKPKTEPSLDYDEVVMELDDILAKCDYICNMLPSTDQTRGLLDNDTLSKCLKRPYFINVGRGDIIKPENLIKAIENNWISGAVLDVFCEEPLPKDNQIWKMPQVHITPHIAALTTSREFAKFAASNYLRFVNGEKLLNIVDWNAGY